MIEFLLYSNLKTSYNRACQVAKRKVHKRTFLFLPFACPDVVVKSSVSSITFCKPLCLQTSGMKIVGWNLSFHRFSVTWFAFYSEASGHFFHVHFDFIKISTWKKHLERSTLGVILIQPLSLIENWRNIYVLGFWTSMSKNGFLKNIFRLS